MWFNAMKLLFLLLAILAVYGRKHPTGNQSSRPTNPKIPLLSRQLHPKIEYVRVCDENPSELRLFDITISNVGTKSTVNGSFSVAREIHNITKSVVTIRRCDSPESEYSCELFHTWRFGTETCNLIEMKNQIWSDIFLAMHPNVKCPIQQGEYRIVNATLDIKSVQIVFTTYPIEKYFWRVRVDAFDPKYFACFAFGASFYR